MSAAVCYVYIAVYNLCQVIDSQLQINKEPMKNIKQWYAMLRYTSVPSSESEAIVCTWTSCVLKENAQGNKDESAMNAIRI